MAAILVGLNAASYTQTQKNPESEQAPNRSSYNAGPTGSRAFYTLLAETGRKAVRWQEPVDALGTRRRDVPSTFIVIGTVRREFTDAEETALLRWVSSGGRLVIIDRDPPETLRTTTANWKIDLKPQNQLQLSDVDPADQHQMTIDTAAAKPGQPSLFTQGVNAIQTSKFASSIVFEPISDTQVSKSQNSPPPRRAPKKAGLRVGPQQGEKKAVGGESGSPSEAMPPTPATNARSVPSATPTPIDDDDLVLDDSTDRGESSPSLFAPIVLISSNGRNLLVDVPFGNGRIVYLSDPYVVSNGGISLVDNSQLAINIVSNGDGIIAFDEYHQGFGGNNRFLEFFAGTPVVAIFFQCVLLTTLVFFSRSRRFGRALPEVEPDRLTKLEYVSAMAELQRRTGSFDLAIENIYRDFRRRAARLVGVDNNSVSRKEFADRIAVRANTDPKAVEELLFLCDDIVYGEPTNKREVLAAVTRIRETEYALGLRKRPDK